MPSPEDLRSILEAHFKKSAKRGVILHGPKCTMQDCLDPFEGFHNGKLPMSTDDLAAQVHANTGKLFTGDQLEGFLRGLEKEARGPTPLEFYHLGVELRKWYKSILPPKAL